MKRGRDTGLLYGIFTRRQSAFFSEKNRCTNNEKVLSIGTAENHSTFRRLAANSVPHDQVNCWYDQRIVGYCRGGPFHSRWHPLCLGTGDA